MSDRQTADCRLSELRKRFIERVATVGEKFVQQIYTDLGIIYIIIIGDQR